MMSENTQASGAGNILFYTPGADVLGRLICWFTQSPYCHVAIQRDDTTVIEATGRGIQRRVYGQRLPAAVFDYATGSKDVDPQDFASAMTWLDGMVGQPYGYSDIMTVISPFRKLFYIVQLKRYICSALATEWLIKAGGVDLNGFDEDPHNVTPRDLAVTIKPVSLANRLHV